MAETVHPPILLVEDDPNDAEMTLRTLRSRDLASEVRHVKDGAEALAFLFATGAYSGRRVEDRPAVVILDIKLPKVDGLEVLRLVKSDPRTRSVPVVMLTSSGQETDLAEAYRLGANSYVVKPVEFENFVETIGRLGLYWAVVNRAPR